MYNNCDKPCKSYYHNYSTTHDKTTGFETTM